MILHCLFVQRKDEEFAPEPLEICNEYVMDENPEWMEKKIKEALGYDEYSSHAIIKIKLSKNGIKAIKHKLNDNNIIVSGMVED